MILVSLALKQGLRERESETTFVYLKFYSSDILNGILSVVISYFLVKTCLCGALVTKIKIGYAVSVHQKKECRTVRRQFTQFAHHIASYGTFCGILIVYPSVKSFTLCKNYFYKFI